MFGEVSEEELEQKLSTLNTLKDQQKTLFFIIIRKFVEVLNENIAKSGIKVEEGDASETANNPHWIKWMTERFEDVLLLVRANKFDYFLN